MNTRMTIRSRLPLLLVQKLIIAKASINSISSKLEVIIDSKTIVYAVRILIILVALLMGYIHTPSKEHQLSRTNIIKTQKPEQAGSNNTIGELAVIN